CCFHVLHAGSAAHAPIYVLVETMRYSQYTLVDQKASWAEVSANLAGLGTTGKVGIMVEGGVIAVVAYAHVRLVAVQRRSRLEVKRVTPIAIQIAAGIDAVAVIQGHVKAVSGVADAEVGQVGIHLPEKDGAELLSFCGKQRFFHRLPLKVELHCGG